MGGLFMGIRYFALISFLICCGLFGNRLKISFERRDPYSKSINALSLIGALCLTLGAIDPFGASGIFPWHVYYICDEVGAASMLCAAVLMIDSIVKVGRSIELSKKASLVQGLNKTVSPIHTHASATHASATHTRICHTHTHLPHTQHID